MRLVPAIDLRGGRCVRLLQGRFDAETVYADDPVEVLERYLAFGARLVHVVDLDGARGGTPANLDALARLAERCAATAGASLQVGGGLRDEAAVARVLEVGAARAVIGSAAVDNPQTVAAILRRRGPEAVVLAFDVRIGEDGEPQLATHGWEHQTRLSLWDAVRRFEPFGLRHVLCTDVARDGALTGPNLELYSTAVQRFPGIAWQASGGVRDAADLTRLRATNVAAVISGRALLEGRMQDQELQPFLRDA
jgi:phosphoribosylformimino-5-aminoimidazole carboxamide ribotide isomerase